MSALSPFADFREPAVGTMSSLHFRGKHLSARIKNLKA